MLRQLTGRLTAQESPQTSAGVARPIGERSSVAKPDEPQEVMSLEPSRLRLIRDRVARDFYQSGEPAERIAVAVLAALKDFDKAPRPH